VRAAVLRSYGELPRIEELEAPRPVAGEALVRVGATGLCATDLKLIAGALPDTELPRIPGHEIAGTVAEAPGAPELEGRRVACHLYESCGRCRACRRGRETLCESGARPGVERDGGLAEWVTVARRSLLPLSKGTPFAEAAVAMDAVASPWAALHGKGALRRGETVAIVGCGGLGSNAVQIALGVGARTAIVDPLASHRELGLELGADLAVAPDEAEAIVDWSGGGVDLALEASGRDAGFRTAAALVAPAGRIVCNGYHPGRDYALDSTRLVLDEIAVIGSRAATLAESAAALAAVEDGRVRPRIAETLPLESVGEALRRLEAGAVDGRLVVAPEAA
jgi:D-arabinose 1-dehydrogenase-like Zn-dependent alcohol dehydrogenase